MRIEGWTTEDEEKEDKEKEDKEKNKKNQKNKRQRKRKKKKKKKKKNKRKFLWRDSIEKSRNWKGGREGRVRGGRGGQ